uniref:Putative ovule protein n=1 Tax=Solanum chacoense TaxID=4108 RepID=A0A0V0HR57_SOLCH
MKIYSSVQLCAGLYVLEFKHSCGFSVFFFKKDLLYDSLLLRYVLAILSFIMYVWVYILTHIHTYIEKMTEMVLNV